MRVFAALLLLAAASAAQDPLLHDERVWVGFVEVTATSREPVDGRGREVQRERLDVRLGTVPPRQSINWARVPLRLRSVKGTWELDVDVAEGEGDARVVRSGAGRGRLQAILEGYVEPKSGRYRLRVRASPSRLVARTTMSGKHDGRFKVWRTVVVRKPFLADFKTDGEANAARTLIEGEKRLLDKSAGLPRDVVIRWRFERVDPVVHGRVVDHRGRPLAGVKVVARFRRGKQRLVRTADTEKDGSFTMPALWGWWDVQALGRSADGVLVEGRAGLGVSLTREKAPAVAIELRAFELAKLPRPQLFLQHFQRDAERYFAYLRERYPERRLDAALLVPPAEG